MPCKHHSVFSYWERIPFHQWCRRWGVQGVQVNPQKFWFVENLSKITENFDKTENLGKIPEDPDKKGAQRCLTFKMAPKLCRKTQLRPFFGFTPKTGLHVLCERNFVGKRRTKTFRASLGKFGQKSFAPQNVACSYTYAFDRHWLILMRKRKSDFNVIFDVEDIKKVAETQETHFCCSVVYYDTDVFLL